MFLVRESSNAKIGNAAATYAPIKATCPTSCPLRDKGCYAQGGNVGMNVRRLETTYAGLNGDTLATLEAAEIVDAAPTNRLPLRLHVSGDATTPYRARTLSDACKSWQAPVWAYTHAWRDVQRDNWGTVSVLASCETITAAKEALAAGYAAAYADASSCQGWQGLHPRWCPGYPVSEPNARREVHRLQAML